MATTFEYGTCRLRDLQVPPAPEAADKPLGCKMTKSLTLKDRPVTPSKRFWNSLQVNPKIQQVALRTMRALAATNVELPAWMVKRAPAGKPNSSPTSRYPPLSRPGR